MIGASDGCVFDCDPSGSLPGGRRFESCPRYKDLEIAMTQVVAFRMVGAQRRSCPRHCQDQTAEQALAEDEAGYEDRTESIVQVHHDRPPAGHLSAVESDS